MVKLVVNGEGFEVDERINGLTDFFKDLSQFEGKKEDVTLTTHKK